MSKKILNAEVKEFIVKGLANYETPSAVAASVKEKFGIEIKRQTAHLYDPTRVAGRDLSENLKRLFEETRAAYLKKMDERTDLLIKEKIKRIHPYRFP